MRRGRKRGTKTVPAWIKLRSHPEHAKKLYKIISHLSKHLGYEDPRQVTCDPRAKSNPTTISRFFNAIEEGQHFEYSYESARAILELLGVDLLKLVSEYQHNPDCLSLEYATAHFAKTVDQVPLVTHYDLLLSISGQNRVANPPKIIEPISILSKMTNEQRNTFQKLSQQKTATERYLQRFEPAYDPDAGQSFARIIVEAQTSATCLIGWATFLPCSIVTEAAMSNFHRHLYNVNTSVNDPDYSNECLTQFNAVGNQRRNALIRQIETNPAYQFKHLISRDDFRAFVRVACSTIEEKSSLLAYLEKLHPHVQILLTPVSLSEELTGKISFLRETSPVDSAFCLTSKAATKFAAWRYAGERIWYSKSESFCDQIFGVLARASVLASPLGVRELRHYLQEERWQ